MCPPKKSAKHSDASNQESSNAREKLRNARSKLSESLTEKANETYSQLRQLDQRWNGGNAAQQDFESLYCVFIGYPATLASLIRDGDWEKNQAIRWAIDELDRVHRLAGEILAKWACDFNLDGGLLEVSGEYCRKFLINNLQAWKNGRDGRWPYCLGEKPTSMLPPEVCRPIIDAEVVLKQLRIKLGKPEKQTNDGSNIAKSVETPEGSGAEPDEVLMRKLRGNGRDILRLLWGSGNIERSDLWREIWASKNTSKKKKRISDEPNTKTIDRAVVYLNRRLEELGYCGFEVKHNGGLYWFKTPQK